jgi:hypothetical protein
MGEIGTDEKLGDKMGGDRPREHCIYIYCLMTSNSVLIFCVVAFSFIFNSPNQKDFLKHNHFSNFCLRYASEADIDKY